jgi:DNA mismatch repair protein MutS
MGAGAGNKTALTPSMRQHAAAKEKYPDALIFFRMGDFYELFFDDAVVASRVLDLTLTARNKGAGDDEIPMAGVPHHAASGYLQRLVDAGFKVAICEQMADPKTVKGIVPREVVRVVSSGLLYDDAGLTGRDNVFLAAVERGDDGKVGVARLDLSTGELAACEADDDGAAVAELVRLDPRELLVSEGCREIGERLLGLRGKVAVRSATAALDADLVLAQQLGAGEAFKSCPSDVARRAAARCVQTAQESQPGARLPLTRLVSYVLGDTLILDEATQVHLELVRTMNGETRGSLLAQIDLTETAAGGRLLKRRLLAPRTDVEEIRRRHDGVELFVTQPGLRREVRARLAKVGDLERLAVKLETDKAGPRELASLRSSLAELPALDAAVRSCPDRTAREALRVEDAANGDAPWLDVAVDLWEKLQRAVSDDPPIKLSDGQVIRAGYDPALDEARVLNREGQKLLVELETRLKESSRIPTVKVRYTRVFGWYLEITKSHATRAPSEWRRKQTVAAGERYTCDELDELASKLLHAEELLASREATLFAELVRELAPHGDRLRALAARLAEWDVAAALAEVAHRDDYARPQVDDSLSLVLEDARHPVVERLAAAGRFVPNDVALDASPTPEDGRSRLWLVTGPNMAGKSTLMRQVALAVILGQMGSFVPARRAHIGVVDRVLTRVGASDNLSAGESTFMVEMKETAGVLRRATRRSLVILDEIGRGTSTYDGLSIAWAVAEHLHDVAHCRALFATHYHELTELGATHPGCENYSVTAREHEGEIVFLHKLQRGAASRSYGVACARLAGVPEPVIARARILLETLERGGGMPGAPAATAGEATGQGALPGKASKKPQLDLFAGAAPPAVPPAVTAALDTLRQIDVDRLTPLEALTLVDRLKRALGPA